MNHVKQKDGLGSCGCVAYASILGLTELDAIREVWGELRAQGGTRPDEVMEALKHRGLRSHAIQVNTKISKLWWLTSLSNHFPIWAVIKSGKSTHAIAIGNGLIYDSHLETSYPIDLYHNRTLTTIIIIDKEQENYGTCNSTY